MRLDTLPFLPRAMTSCSASSPLNRVMALRHVGGGQQGGGEGLSGASCLSGPCGKKVGGASEGDGSAMYPPPHPGGPPYTHVTPSSQPARISKVSADSQMHASSEEASSLTSGSTAPLFTH